MLITNAGGQVLKQIKLSGTVKGTLNVKTSELGAGSYQYSLVMIGELLNQADVTSEIIETLLALG